MIVGFGVGMSMGTCIVDLKNTTLIMEFIMIKFNGENILVTGASDGLARLFAYYLIL